MEHRIYCHQWKEPWPRCRYTLPLVLVSVGNLAIMAVTMITWSRPSCTTNHTNKEEKLVGVAVPLPTGLAPTSKLRPAYCSGYCRASIVTWATSLRGILGESVPVVSTTNSRPGHWSSSRMDNGILDLFCSSGSLFHQVDLQFALPLDYHSTRCRSMVIVGLPSQIFEGMLVQVRPAMVEQITSTT